MMIQTYIICALLSGTTVFGTPIERAITSRMFHVNDAASKQRVMMINEDFLLMDDWNRLCNEVRTMLPNVIPGKQRVFRDTLLKNIWGTMDTFSADYRNWRDPAEVRANARSGRLYAGIIGTVVMAVEDDLHPRYIINGLDLEAELRRRRLVAEKISYIESLKEKFATERETIFQKLVNVLPQLNLSPEDQSTLENTLFPEGRPVQMRAEQEAVQEMPGRQAAPEALQQRLEEELRRARGEWNQEQIERMRVRAEEERQLRHPPQDNFGRLFDDFAAHSRGALQDFSIQRDQSTLLRNWTVTQYATDLQKVHKTPRKKGFFSRIFSFLKRKHKD